MGIGNQLRCGSGDTISVGGIEDHAVAVITLLRKEGRATDAHDLALAAADLRTKGKLKATLEAIIERCSVRWLGDIPLTKVSCSEWLRSLNALESAARAQLRLEQGNTSNNGNAAYEKAEREASKRTADRRAPAPWALRSKADIHDDWRTKEKAAPKKRINIATLRTLSATARNMGGRNDRWMSDGPVEQATTPFIQKLIYFLPPFALLMYCVIVMVDSIPDLYPPETIIVNGVVQR